MGIAADEVQGRIDAMTDEEVRSLAGRLNAVPAGGALMYERRWRGREKMGRDGAVLRDHAFYAPVGMSESAYKEALQTIQFPD